jgi:hypothetical protein
MSQGVIVEKPELGGLHYRYERRTTGCRPAGRRRGCSDTYHFGIFMPVTDSPTWVDKDR